jgi:hypothetical protein
MPGILAIGLLLAPLAVLNGTSPDGPSGSHETALFHRVHTLRLVEERIWVHIYERPGSGLTLVNLHDNENTCVEAAQEYIRRHGGRLVELQHGRGREVVIRRDGELFRFDPNRMFTPAGLEQTLTYYHAFTPENRSLAAVFARRILRFINVRKGKPIIAVHNNIPDKLTIYDFYPGEWYGADAREVHVNPARDHDDFFFVNSPALYLALAAQGFNVALQSEHPLDRGTLGYYVHGMGGIYVNVEAQEGHLREQIEMLEAVGLLLTGESPLVYGASAP